MIVVAVKEGSQWRVTVTTPITTATYWQGGSRAAAIRDAIASVEAMEKREP